MNYSKVRCWEAKVFNETTGQWETHLISYPEDNVGYDLITCLNCGCVYSASVSKQVYIGPKIGELMKNFHCIKCNKSMSNNFALYPETFIGKDGYIGHLERPQEIPLDEDSKIIEFPELYT